MPQLFQVLRCMKCLIFQVHQTKKSNKWDCKICGEKQSIKRNYAIGTAKDCRVHVQKLNGIRGKIDESMADIENEDGFDSDDNCGVKEMRVSHQKSKWSSYAEESEEVEKTEVKQEWSSAQVVLELPKKKKKGNIPVITDLITAKCTDNIKPKLAKNITCNEEVLDEVKNFQTQINKIKSTNDSKWGQFLDEQSVSVSNEKNIVENGGNIYKTKKNCNITGEKVTVKPQTIFSTCDDNEIDDILNIEV